MSEKELIKEQLKFVEWLKQQGLYNPAYSAYLMQKMFEVWQAATSPLERPHINELLES